MTLLSTRWRGSPPFARSIQRSTDGSTRAVSSIWKYSALAADAADSKSASSSALTFVIICGMITSRPLARWTRAIAAARCIAASNEYEKLFLQPPIRAVTRSISRLRTPGCRSAKTLATVDFPMPGGPFRCMNRATCDRLPSPHPLLLPAVPPAKLARYAIAEVDDSRAEGAGLDEFEIHPALVLRKERYSSANQHRVDPGSVLVDQAQLGSLRGESCAADPDVALPGLGS